MSMELQGMKELLAQIEQLGKRMGRTAEGKVLTEGGEFLKEKLQEVVPIKHTGNWNENIEVSPPIYDFKVGTMVDVGADQQGPGFYGYFYEFGISKQPARPVFGPTFEANKQALQDKMGEAIKRELGL